MLNPSNNVFMCRTNWLLQNQMVSNDRLERDRTAAKNGVEEYVYEMREKLYETLVPYVLEAVST